MRNDLPKAITAEDVIRRFDLSSLVKDRRKINENKDGLDKTENILYNFIDGILKGLNNTENQVDGKISTWFFTGIPTLENEPANVWNTDTLKNNHIGDLYYDKANGNTYQFIYGNEEYSWEQVIDSDVNQAMALANSNPDTQDGLRNIFVVDPIPPYEVGDMWIKSNGDIYRCIVARESGNLNLAEWVISSEYSNDNYVYDAKAIIDSFNEFITANYVCKVLVKTTNNSIELSVSSATTKITNDYTRAISESEGRAEIREGQVLLSANRYTSGEIARVEGEIGDIADITQTEESDEAKVSFTNVPLSEPINLIIYPINENISYLYPNAGLFPSATLYPKIRTLRFTNTTENTHIDYELPDDLLYYDSDNYDTLELDYANQICRVTKKCKYNNDGTVGLLEETEVTNYPYPQIELTLGDYDIELLCYTAGHIFARLMSNNVYVGQFVTHTKLNASVNVLPHTIELTTEEQVSGTQCGITIKLRDANGNELDSEDANITLSGLVKFTDLSNSGSTIINGSNIKTGTIDASLVNVTNINATNIKSGNIQSTNYVANTSGTKIDLSNGSIDTKNFKVDSSGNVSISGYVNATSGSIGGCTISNGLLQIAAARITSGTLDSARIPNLSADKITTGTLNANNINITNLNASNINSGTLTGAGINIYNGVGFLKMIWDSNHPYVSALNVGSGSGGISFRSSGSRYDLGGQVGHIYGSSAGNVVIEGNTGTWIQDINIQTNYIMNCYQLSGLENTYIRLNYSVVLKPNPYGGAYIWGTEDYNKILTVGGSPSTLSIKENVREKETNDIPNMLNKIKLYDYNYIKEINNGKEDYGYIIDYLENIEGIDKYFVFNEVERNGLKYKTINHEHLSKFLLGAVIELQKEINSLKEENNE